MSTKGSYLKLQALYNSLLGCGEWTKSMHCLLIAPRQTGRCGTGTQKVRDLALATRQRLCPHWEASHHPEPSESGTVPEGPVLPTRL